jgi:hypothetical protein
VAGRRSAADVKFRLSGASGLAHQIYGGHGIPAKITARPVIIDEIECITERNRDGHQEVPIDE